MTKIIISCSTTFKKINTITKLLFEGTKVMEHVYNNKLTFRAGTHVRCQGPILRRGNISLPFSASSPPSAGRPGWPRPPGWCPTRARQGRSEPRWPPPRTPPCSESGPGDTHPACEPCRPADTNTQPLSDGPSHTWSSQVRSPQQPGDLETDRSTGPTMFSLS